MADTNRVVVAGRLTREPDLRTTSSGSMVLSFSIANNERRHNLQSNQWEDYTNFFDCTMFGNQAESLSRILCKGMLVNVDGKLRWSSWERDGEKHSKVEIIVNEVMFLNKIERNSDQNRFKNEPKKEIYDADIPF